MTLSALYRNRVKIIEQIRKNTNRDRTSRQETDRDKEEFCHLLSHKSSRIPSPAFLKHMARLSKAATFADADMPACDTTSLCQETSTPSESPEDSVPHVEDILQFYTRRQTLDKQPDSDADDEGRRGSTLTTASISSFPESTICQTDQNGLSFPAGRPAFRRPDSMRRLHMGSPSPSPRRISRRGNFSSSKSKRGTPKILRTGTNDSSRTVMTSCDEETESDEEIEENTYPLVLLHVTLLPINLPWSTASMEELLPQGTLDNLQLLEGKILDTVLQRGILLPHPRFEYELLEERLLEALELKSARLTKCGHFQGRASDHSVLSDGDGTDSDSGVGSSVDSADVCATCQNRVKVSLFGTTGTSKKWTVKIFAANGLLNASSWVAAWTEMESVDVEILPHISDETRRLLDHRRREEVDQDNQEDEQRRIRELVAAEVRVAWEERELAEQQARSCNNRDTLDSNTTSTTDVECLRPDEHPPRPENTARKHSTLATSPPIYKSSQIPLSLLLRNYLYLLAQDKRNVAVFFLAVLAIFFALHASRVSPTMCVTPAEHERPQTVHHALEALSFTRGDAAEEDIKAVEPISNEAFSTNGLAEGLKHATHRGAATSPEQICSETADCRASEINQHDVCVPDVCLGAEWIFRSYDANCPAES